MLPGAGVLLGAGVGTRDGDGLPLLQLDHATGMACPCSCCSYRRRRRLERAITTHHAHAAMVAPMAHPAAPSTQLLLQLLPSPTATPPHPCLTTSPPHAFPSPPQAGLIMVGVANGFTIIFMGLYEAPAAEPVSTEYKMTAKPSPV